MIRPLPVRTEPPLHPEASSSSRRDPTYTWGTVFVPEEPIQQLLHLLTTGYTSREGAGRLQIPAAGAEKEAQAKPIALGCQKTIVLPGKTPHHHACF